MPYLLQDLSKLKSKTALTTKPSKITVGQDYIQALDNTQSHTPDTKVQTEFRIQTGTQDYKICILGDVYMVKPCSPEDSDMLPITSDMVPITEKRSQNVLVSKKCSQNSLVIKKSSDDILQPSKVNNKSKANSLLKRSAKSAIGRPQRYPSNSYKKETWNKSTHLSKEIKLKDSGEDNSINKKSRDSFNLVNLAIKRGSPIVYNKESWNRPTPIAREIKLKDSGKEYSAHNKKSRHFFNLINQAIKLQKVFTIGNQNKRAFPVIRDALKARGWVEKSLEIAPEEHMAHSKIAEITMRLLKESPVNFVWIINHLDFGSVKEDTIVSRFPKNNHFTTKVGLCSFLEDFHWFYENGVSKTISPKTFTISTGDDIDNVIIEFGLTACVALLKTVVDQVSNAESDYFFRNGKVPINTVDFANAQCSEYIIYRQHDDIDRQEDNQTSAKEWTDFLNWFSMIAHDKEHFQTTSYPMIQALYTMSKLTLKNIEPFWPQMEIEGCKNLWVVKPAAEFCGRGVRVMRNIEDIISHVEVTTDSKISRHIVQKYIERPLLICNTKFDIRQWFLITSVYPLVIWMYKECYLRFSSQPFSLENLHESIHLTNNAIQRNYTNNCARDTKLPPENMWHCATFQEYLKEIGEPDKWEKVILPGIKEGIVGAVLASQDEMIERQNSFELYGADFLLGTNYTPLLLEINTGPSMAPSTRVTADLCRRGLQDMIKVVLDRRKNPQADTGNFEILYKQEMGPKQHHVGLDLVVCGSKITPERRIKNYK